MKFVLILLIAVICSIGNAQTNPHLIENYRYIDYEKNKISVFGCNKEFDNLFSIFDTLLTQGSGKCHILHIGDSHIQADYFSGQMRRKLYEYFPGAMGSRGIVFPYDVAGTNNPANYYTNKTGTWNVCKNISKKQICNIGISGMALITYSNNSSLEFFQRNWDNYPIYNFDIIKVFHRVDSTSFSIIVESNAKVIDTVVNRRLGYTQFKLDSSVTAIKLKFVKKDSLQNSFEYYGLGLESSFQGITYSACGVNGADTEDWLRCNLFEPHLRAINPQLVIISLGTNDGYNKYFSESAFTQEYEQLIVKIKKVLPRTPILLTTPGDNYRYKRYLNTNTEKTQSLILALAQKHNCAVWDFYEIMGGQNSIILWDNDGLTAGDRLHYSKKGYLFQGDLLFSAFMKLYDKHIESKAKSINKKPLDF